MITIRTLHPGLPQKMHISNSKAVIRYVEHPSTTCSFRGKTVSTHKMYWKVIAMLVYIHNSAIISYTCTALTQNIDIFDSRVDFQSAQRPYTTCSFRVMDVSKHKTAYQKETATSGCIHNTAI